MKTMIVYIEDILLENFIITYLLLFLTQKLSHCEKKKLFIIACLFGSISAVVFPFLLFSQTLNLIFKLLISCGIVCLAFKFNSIKNYLYIFSSFLGVTATFIGGILLLNYNFPNITKSYKTIALVFIFIFVLMTKWSQRLLQQKRQTQFIYTLKITNGKSLVTAKAYLDSGCSITDPITQKPVIIVSYDLFKQLYEDADLVKLISGKNDFLTNPHYIKCGTILANSKLLVFDIESIEISSENFSKSIQNACLGLTYSNFKRTLNSDALISPHIL